MPANPTPRNNRTLRAQAHDMMRGCQQLEGSVGIKHNTATALAFVIHESAQAEMEVGRRLKVRADAYAELAAADEAGLRTLTDCKLTLARQFGLRWNAHWEAAGFPDRSTAVPRTMDPRYVLLSSLALYFTEHPEQQAPSMDATAALCTAAHQRLAHARHAVANAESALTTAYRARRAANLMLRKRVRGLRLELWGLLEKDDARWLVFGLNIPARLSRPEPVETLTVEPVGPDGALVEWPFAARMHRSRVEARVVGAEDDFRPVRTVRGLQVWLRGYAPGQEVEFRIVAANSAGEAPPSPSVRVTIGSPALAPTS